MPADDEPGRRASAVADRIRTLRNRQGWTQVELARRAGISATMVSKLERGVGRHPSLRVMAAMAGVFGLQVEDFHPVQPGSELSVRMGKGGGPLNELVSEITDDKRKSRFEFTIPTEVPARTLARRFVSLTLNGEAMIEIQPRSYGTNLTFTFFKRDDVVAKWSEDH